MWLWLGCALSFVGYASFFLALHVHSIGWAPGQVLDSATSYWQFIFRTFFSEPHVLASRRSALATYHPLLLIATLVPISLGYILILYTLRGLPSTRQPRLRVLVGIALVCGMLLLFLPNLLSGDIYSYISFGRIAAIHKGNPFIDPPSRYPYDPYFRFVGWTDVPSVYGPPWIYLSILITMLVESIRSTPTTYVLAYKVLALLLHLVNGRLIWAILRRWRPEQVAWGTALYLLNPLTLIEFAGNGHNDVLMITWILLGVLLHIRGQWQWAVASFTIAALTKWIALPLLPLYGLLLISSWSGVRQLATYVFGTASIISALTVLLYLPFWQGMATLRILESAPPQTRLINSLGELLVHEVTYGMYELGQWPHPALADWEPLIVGAPQEARIDGSDSESWRNRQRVRLQRYNQAQQHLQIVALHHRETVERVVRGAGIVLMLAACLIGAAITRDLRRMLLAAAWIFFLYTTIGAVWVWPWYATWFVALAALLDWRVTGRTAILLSMLILLLYPLHPALPEGTLVEQLRTVIVFGPPLVFAGYQLQRFIRTRPRRARRSGGTTRTSSEIGNPKHGGVVVNWDPTRHPAPDAG